MAAEPAAGATICRTTVSGGCGRPEPHMLVFAYALSFKGFVTRFLVVASIAFDYIKALLDIFSHSHDLDSIHQYTVAFCGINRECHQHGQAKAGAGRRLLPRDNDFAWGREEIGEVIGRSPSQVSYLLSRGFFGDVVRRVGHKTLIASKRKLRALAAESSMTLKRKRAHCGQRCAFSVCPLGRETMRPLC